VSPHADYIEHALELIGTPYRWAGKDPASGLDCSGFITYALWKATGLDLRDSHNTDRMWNEWEPARFPRAGDVALFGGTGAQDVEHVMMVLPLDGDELPELLVGACGGDRTTTTLREAQRRGARVQVKQGTGYRSDFRGYCKVPIP
jgi:hypothetical protein